MLQWFLAELIQTMLEIKKASMEAGFSETEPPERQFLCDSL